MELYIDDCVFQLLSKAMHAFDQRVVAVGPIPHGLEYEGGGGGGEAKEPCSISPTLSSYAHFFSCSFNQLSLVQLVVGSDVYFTQGRGRVVI